jgi:hypothetical protein
MSMSLEEFAGRCRAALLADGGPGGREGVCQLVREALGDKDFLAAQLPDGAPSSTSQVPAPLNSNFAIRTFSTRPWPSTRRESASDVNRDVAQALRNVSPALQVGPWRDRPARSLPAPERWGWLWVRRSRCEVRVRERQLCTS